MGLMSNAKALVNPDSVTEHGANVLSFGEKRQESKAYSTPRAITASGEKINLKSADDVQSLRNRVYTEWQNDAWAYYDAIGEIKYGFGVVGAAASRIRMYAALTFDEDSVPTPVSDYQHRIEEENLAGPPKGAVNDEKLPGNITNEVLDEMERLVRDLRSGSGGASGFLRMFTVNMCVAGECYLVNLKGRWHIRSTSELIVDQTNRIILRSQRSNSSTTSAGTVMGDVILPRNTPFFRIWREHPRYSHEPESSLMGLREVCDELITLQRMIRTIARSRMNAGLLFIPEGLTAAGSSVTEDVRTAEQEMDALVASLYDSITAPILDEANGASVVPTIITGPAEAGDKIKYIEINRKVDQWLADRIDKTLLRLMQGMDMPKDIITGMSQVKYNNAEHTQDAMYTDHVEPLVMVLCDALTHSYFRPLLKRKFQELTNTDLDYLGIWYDPSEVVTKANPAAAADKGFENFSLSGDAWRKANGFADSDAPSEQELAMRFMLSKGPLQPEQMATLFKNAFPGVVDSARATNLKDSPVPMPESAQKLLFGEVVAPADQSTRDGANDPDAASTTSTKNGRGAAAPSPAEDAASRGRPSQIQDRSIDPTRTARSNGAAASNFTSRQN